MKKTLLYLLVILFIPVSSLSAEETLVFGVASIISPESSFELYQGMREYLEDKTGVKTEIKVRPSYEEMNQLLIKGEVDIASICTGAYLLLQRQQVRLLAVPVVRGESAYWSYIITSKKSDINGIGDLKGRSFVFTDRLSNSGAFYPRYLTKTEYGLSAENYFSKIFYSGSHDRSIYLVNVDAVDGAAVDSLVYDFLKEEDPLKISNIIILRKSQKFTTPPFVSRGNIKPEKLKQLRSIFASMHEDPEGRSILRGLKIDHFILPQRKDFESARHVWEVGREP